MKKSKGQSAAEYAMLLAAILLIASTAFYAFGCNVRIAVNGVNTALTGNGR